jgi:hypothetical protein
MTPLFGDHGADCFPRTAFSLVGGVFPADEAVHFFSGIARFKADAEFGFGAKKFLLLSMPINKELKPVKEWNGLAVHIIKGN